MSHERLSGMRGTLVGRQPELRDLEEALARALATKTPQAVTIIGTPGIGKTRLLSELLVRVRERERKVRTLRASARANDPPYGAVRRLLRARFGVADSADPALVMDSVRAQVTDVLGDRRVGDFLHFLGRMMGLLFPESPFIKAVEEDPEQVDRLSRAVLRGFVEDDASKGPMVLCFEEMHLAEDDTLDLVQYLLETASDAPLLLVVTARPELLSRRPGWFDTAPDRHLRLELGPLHPDDAGALVAELLGRVAELPEDVIDAAVDMSGGSPFLIEQVVRLFLENGTVYQTEDGRWSVHADRLEEARLPMTVEDAIQSRVASLSRAERDLLEAASVMGSVFWLGGLVAIGRLGKPRPELWGGGEDLAPHYRDLLHALEERDYALAMPDSSVPRDEEWAFKHNLERETIERLMSAATRQRFHKTIAEWLELRLPERTEEQLTLLAHHHEHGGNRQRAGHYSIAAGNLARQRYALQKASDLYAHGLELIGDGFAPLRIETLHDYGDVLSRMGRTDEALVAFRRMLDLAWSADHKSKGGAAHNRIGRVHRDRGELEDAMRHLGTGHALFHAAGDTRGVASSLDDIGKVHWIRGRYEQAERQAREALEIREQVGDPRSIALSHNNLGLILVDSGRFTEAIEHFERALDLRRTVGDLAGVAQTLNNLGTVSQDDGNDERAVELWNEAREVAREAGDQLLCAVVLTNIGESHYRLQKPNDALPYLEEAEEIATSLGDRLLLAEIRRAQAKTHMLLGNLPRARELMATSMSGFEAVRSKPHLATALRTMAEITAAGGWGGEQVERARQSFLRSISLCEEVGNELELGRSCQSYGEWLASLPDATDKDREEAAAYRRRAQEIKDRLAGATKRSSSGLFSAPTHGLGSGSSRA